MIYRLIKSTSANPFINLALENHLLFSSDTTSLLLWQNNPCVVIGRNQLPKHECNIFLMKELNIPLVRRYSGGGAVYHDLGNSNYSLITNKEHFSRIHGCELVQRAMKRLNINLLISPRHDLWDNEKKVSGSAFRLTNSRSYHHGTMLRTTDLTLLNKLLQTEEKEEEEGDLPLVKSVKSPVGNIEIGHEEFCKVMSDEFRNIYNCNNLLEEIIGEDEILLREGVNQFYKELASYEWIWNRNHSRTTIQKSLSPEGDEHSSP